MGFGPVRVSVPVVQHQHGAPVRMALQHLGQGGADQVDALFRHGASGEDDDRRTVFDRRAPQVDVDGVGHGEGLGLKTREVLEEVAPRRLADEDQAVHAVVAPLIAPAVDEVTRRLHRIVAIEGDGGVGKIPREGDGLLGLLMELDDVGAIVAQRLTQGLEAVGGGQGVHRQTITAPGAFAAEDADLARIGLGQGAGHRLHGVGLVEAEPRPDRHDDGGSHAGFPGEGYCAAARASSARRRPSSALRSPVNWPFRAGSVVAASRARVSATA